jgi:hypothetical protein
MSSTNGANTPQGAALFRKSGIYEAPDGDLFVPWQSLVLIHEASGLPSVLKRAGHSLTYPHLWRKEFGQVWQEFEDWLYDWRRRRPPPAAVQPTAVMRDCRRETSRGAILRAARKLAQDRGLLGKGPARGFRGPGFSPVALHHALKKYRDRPWFQPWLLRGAELPPEVKLVTPLQANAARRAWHYTELCRRAGIQRDTYAGWIEKGTVPDDWRPWLFGEDAPAGVFVVDRPLLRLQEQMTDKGIAAAAGLHEGTVFHWKRQQDLRGAFEWAISCVERAGSRADRDPRWPEWAMAVRANTREHMLAYLLAAKPVRCCERAGVHKNVYYEKLTEAKQIGVRELLEAFLRRHAPFTGPGGQRCGLVENNFFVPTEEMPAFREVARATAAEQELTRLLRPLKDHPGYRAWFLDWTSPRVPNGKKLREPAVDGQGRQHLVMAATKRPVSKRGPDKTIRTEEIEDHCYDALKAKTKRILIARDVRARFELPRFAEASVTTYARRSAQRSPQKRPWPIKG